MPRRRGCLERTFFTSQPTDHIAVEVKPGALGTQLACIGVPLAEVATVVVRSGLSVGLPAVDVAATAIVL